MTDRLVSPEETSALMEEAPSGAFTFRRPPAFVADREGIFDRAVEELGHDLGRRLGRLLRRSLTLTWTGRDESTLGVPASGSLIFSLSAARRCPVLVIHADLVPLLADLLLGAAEPGEPRELSPLERQVLTPVARVVGEGLATAGVPVGDVTLEERAVESEGEAEPAAVDIVLQAKLEMDGRHGELSLALPPLLARRLVSPPHEGLPGHSHLGVARLSSLGARMQVFMPGGQLRLGDLRRLMPGDVVRLDQREDQPVKVRVNGRRAGWAHLSSRGGRRVAIMERELSVLEKPAKGVEG